MASGMQTYGLPESDRRSECGAACYALNAGAFDSGQCCTARSQWSIFCMVAAQPVSQCRTAPWLATVQRP